MNSRKPLVLIAAAVIAVLAVIVLYSFVSGQKNRAFDDAKMVKVWVVSDQPVPKGTYGQQTSGLIVQDEIPRKFYPGNAITSLDQIQNKVAVADLAPNSIIVEGNFVDPATASVSLSTQLRKIRGTDQVAVTIQVDQVRGTAGMIVPGDFVNVMVTRISGTDLSSGGDGGGGDGAKASCAGVPIPEGSNPGDFLFCEQARVLLQKVEVLAVGQNAVPQPGQEAAVATSSTTQTGDTGLITFIVPMDSAQMLASVPPGNFYLALTSKDYTPKATKPIKPDAPLPSEDPEVLTPYGPNGPN